MTAAEPAGRRAALAFILVTVGLDVLALGVTIPVLQKLILEFEGGDTERAAAIAGWFGTLFALMQFVCSPILGALADRFGRRPVILLSNLGLALDYLLLALAPSLAWLFVARVISGVTSASIPAAFAYVADVTPPDRRARSFGLVGAAFGLGFVLGPAVGGLLGSVDLRLPFWVAAALSFANASYGLFVLPESLPPERRAAFRWRRANPIGSLALLRARPALLGLAATAFLFQLAHESLPAVFVLYTDHRYGWTELDVGLTLTLVGLCGALVQGALTHRVARRFGERRALLLGLVCGSTGFLIYGLAPTGAALLVGVPIMALWGLTGPTVQSLLTRKVAGHEQGQLQGAQSSLRGIAALIGPGLYTSVFRWGIAGERSTPWPGVPYLLAACLLLAALSVGFVVTRPSVEAAPT
ncbi:MAG: TCR/Tet family MFS transporter [Planctomycetota bacterium]